MIESTGRKINGTLNVTGNADFDAAVNIDGAVTINDAGADVDFRVEGDTNPNLIFADASLDGVGIGVAPTTRLGVQAGTTSNDAAVGGMLYSQPLAVGNVGTGEDDLLNFSLPANTLAVDGQGLEIWAVFTPVNNANAKTFRLRFGATILASTSHPGGGSANPVIMFARCMRVSATSQRWIWHLTGSDNITMTSETLSGAIAIRFTGEAVANNDIVLNQVSIEWKDANT